MNKIYKCLICEKPVADYEPQWCCNGESCSCMGQPINPCVCSMVCDKAFHFGIGKPYEQRRLDAGINKFLAASKFEFGDIVRNNHVSDDNPLRRMMILRETDDFIICTDFDGQDRSFRKDNDLDFVKIGKAIKKQEWTK